MATLAESLRSQGAFSGGAQGIARGAIAEGQKMGAFSAAGSPRMRALLRRRALGLADSSRRRNSTLAQLYGLDPRQRRFAAIESDIGANQGMQESLFGADANEAFGNRDWLRSLYGGQLDFERQRQLAKEQQKAASSGGLGSLAGGLAGSFLGPVGTAIGGKIGGAIR